MASVGADMGASRTGGSRSMYSDRVFLSHITSDPNLGQDKVRPSLFISCTKFMSIRKFDGCKLTIGLSKLSVAACFLQPECLHKPHQA